MYATLLLIFAVLPQADRQDRLRHRAQVKQEARLRDQYPGYYAARQPTPVGPQTVINIYAPVYAPNYGGVMPNYGYGYGRPAWPPQW